MGNVVIVAGRANPLVDVDVDGGFSTASFQCQISSLLSPRQEAFEGEMNGRERLYAALGELEEAKERGLKRLDQDGREYGYDASQGKTKFGDFISILSDPFLILALEAGREELNPERLKLCTRIALETMSNLLCGPGSGVCTGIPGFGSGELRELEARRQAIYDHLVNMVNSAGEILSAAGVTVDMRDYLKNPIPAKIPFMNISTEALMDMGELIHFIPDWRHRHQPNAKRLCHLQIGDKRYDDSDCSVRLVLMEHPDSCWGIKVTSVIESNEGLVVTTADGVDTGNLEELLREYQRKDR